MADPGASHAGSYNLDKPSLSVNADVIVDGIVPRLLNVTAPDGAHAAGSVLQVAVNFDEPMFVYGAAPSLELALDGGTATAAYDALSNGTVSAVFNYAVRQGDVVDRLGYAGTAALAPAGSITDEAGNAAALALPAPGAPGSLSASSRVSVTAAPGRALNVTTPLSSGTYPADYRILVSVSFDKPVSYSGAPPSLDLAVGGVTRTAWYASGNDTRSLAFAYVVQPGDSAAALDYSGHGALSVAGGLRDRAGDAVNSTLPALDGPGSDVAPARIAIDGSAAAYATGVSASAAADGAHRQGAEIDMAVEFSVPVSVVGLPALELATDPPRRAEYESGGGTSSLVFRYVVQQGDAAADLDYAGTGALVLGGGASVRAVSGGAAALLALPVPGELGSLGHSRGIAIDAVAPSVVRAGTTSPDGAYLTGHVVDIEVDFDEPVVVRGEPWIEMAGASGGQSPRAVYASGNGTDRLAFEYVVGPGDSSAASAALGGPAIEDPAGNAASLTLPDLGLAGILVRGGPEPLLFASGRATNGPTFPKLGGAIDAAVIPPGGSADAGTGTLVAVASAAADGVQMVRVHENGTLEAVDDIDDMDAAGLELDEPHGVDAFRLSNGSAYAIVSSITDDGVQLVRVHENGTLEASQSGALADTNDLLLDAVLDIDAFRTANGTTLALVTAFGADHGVQLVRVNENGTLEASQSGALANNASLTLRQSAGVSSFRAANGTVLAVVASHGNNGVQLVRVNEDGTLTATDSLRSSRAANSTVLLNRPVGIDAIRTANGSVLAIATSAGNGAQLIRVHEDSGMLEAKGWLEDDREVNLRTSYGVAAFSMGGRPYALATSDGDHGVQLMRILEDGALEAAGSARDGWEGFEELNRARGVKAFETAGNRTFAIVAARGDNGVQLVRLSPPFVTSVAAAVPDGTYPARYPIEIRVNFSEPVDVSGQPPYLQLRPGNGTARAAEYLSGAGTSSLAFRYVAQPGDGAGRLDYAGPAALATRGAVTDSDVAAAVAAVTAPHRTAADLLPFRASGPNNSLLPSYRTLLPDAPADLKLPAFGSLGLAQNIMITAPPSIVTGVSSPSDNGTYRANDTIDIVVGLSAPVAVAGAPVLALATTPPRNATYVPGTATDELVFRYEIRLGDNATDLDYADANALALGGGASVRDLSRDADAVLTLPEPGAAGSLGHSKDIAIEGAPPSVLRVSSPDPDGAYGTGRIVNITVHFDEPAAVAAAAGAGGRGGAPVLALATTPPRNATYASGSGTEILSFLYTVQPGDSADDLGYAGTGALLLNGAAISDELGNEAAAGSLPLPVPGEPGSLAASKDIAIRGAKTPVLAAVGDAASSSLGFADAHRPAVFEAGNRTYAVVTSYSEGAALLVRVHEDGTLEAADPIADSDNSATFELDGAIGVDALVAGNRTFAVVAALDDDGVQLLEVHPGSETLEAADQIPNSGILELDGAIGVDAFAMGNRTFAIVASLDDDGVQLLEVHPGSGTLEAIHRLDVAAAPGLDGAASVAAFKMGSLMYAAVASRDASDGGGVQLVRIHGNGTLEAAGSLVDNGTLALGAPLSIDVLEMDNRTYAVVAARVDDGVQLVRIHGNGTLEADPAHQLVDGGALRLDAPHGVDAFKMGGAEYAIVAARDDDGVQLVRFREDGTPFPAGSASNDQAFSQLKNAHGVAVFAMGGRTYAMVASTGNDGGVQLIRLSPASATGVSSPQAGGTYPAGYPIRVAVNFDAPVSVSGPPPSLALDLGGGRHGEAEYVSGNGTHSLVFRYTAQPGDDTAALGYVGTAALTTRGIVSDMQARGASAATAPLAAAATAADLELPALASPGSLGGMPGIGIDTVSSASVSGVSSPSANGTYRSGDAVEIAVRFTDTVDVSGAPVLMLATAPPSNATYVSGSGGSELMFLYRVQQGDTAGGLDYAGPTALSLGAAASITGRTDNRPAVLGLPRPGDPGSLGHSKDIAIDGAPPSVLRVSSPDPDGAYGTGRIVNITVHFDEPAAVAAAAGAGGRGGAPVLALATTPPRNATYASGSGTEIMSFLYVVQPGDSADDLGYAGTGALLLNGAAISDELGNEAAAGSLPLPVPGEPGSLAASKDIAIRGAKTPVLAAVGDVASSSSLGFAGAHRPAVFEAGNRTFAVVTSYSEGAALLVRVHENGTLEAADRIADSDNSATFELDGAIGVDALEAGNRTFAIVASLGDNGVQLLEVHPGSETLEAADQIPNSGILELEGAIGVDAFAMGNRTFAIVASLYDDGVQLLEVHPGSGTLDAIHRLDVAAAPGLDGAASVAAFKMGSLMYAAVASRDANGGGGVQLVRIHGSGTLEAAGSLVDNGTLALGAPLSIDVLEAGNRTYAVVAARDDDGVQTVRIYKDGTLEADPHHKLVDGGALRLDAPHGVDAFKMGGAEYAIVAARDDDGVQLVRIHGNGTLEAAGSAANGMRFPRLDAAHGVDVFDMGGRTYAMVASTGNDNAASAGVQLIRLSPASATGVSSPQAGGTYPAGYPIRVAVNFDAPVSVSGPPPSLALDLGGGRRGEAEYVSGNGTHSLVFRYTAQPGDDTGALGYVGTAALTTRGIVEDLRAAGAVAAGADLELPPPGSPGSLGYLDIRIDARAPSVQGVSFLNGSGAYGPGSAIRIAVEFDENVIVDGLPELALSTSPPANATYDSGSGSDTLEFLYTVRIGDVADPLAYAGRAALSAADGGASIRDELENDADLELPPPGSPDPSGIRIDARAPSVQGVSFLNESGSYGPGSAIRIAVEFDENVIVDGLPELALSTSPPANATYDSGSGSDTLEFLYTVRIGDVADPLAYAGRAALSAADGGASIRDELENDADLELPPPGSPDPSGIRIDTGAPSVQGVSFLNESGSYGPGSAIRIAVEFDENVIVDGLPELALSTSPPANATYDSGSGSDTLEFLYTVRIGDVADPLAYAGRTALSASDGDAASIRDEAGNDADLELPDPASRAPSDPLIVIDGRPPAGRPEPVSVHVLQRAGGDPLQAPASYSAGQTIVVAVRFTAPVEVDAGAEGAEGAAAVPHVRLRTGSAGAFAPYASGSGTDTLEFEYAVRGGDLTGRLSYAGTGALSLNGSAIAAAGSGSAAALGLPVPGSPGSLSHSGSPAVRIDPEPGRPVLQVGILDEAGRGGSASLAATAAAYEFNELQGRAAGALIVNATAYDAGATAGSAAAALRAAHAGGAGPSVYVGLSTDRGLHAAMPYAAENNIVLVSAGSTAPSLAVEDDTVFRMLPSSLLDAEALARLARGASAASMHAVLENATHGPPAGASLEDATPPPPDRFSHAFDAALAYIGVPALSGTVVLEGRAGSYGAAAAAEALDASVRSSTDGPDAVVYMGSPAGLAALAEASAGYPALASAEWLASGLSAGSSLLAGGSPAAEFAADTGLSSAVWSVPASALAREVDSLAQLPPGADAGARHRAYAAYDAVLVIGAAAAEAAGAARGGVAAPDAAAVADSLPGAAAAYSGALGDIAMDNAGDLWVPAKYDLWTVGRADGGADGGGGGSAEWSRQPSALDEERACSIALARAKIDYGPIDSGQTSRPHLQTIVNTGQLPFSRVDLTATPWHVDSPGACEPGDLPSLPVGLSEIRTELGGRFSDLAASGTTLAQGLKAGAESPLWYRLSLVGYADLPQAQITQCATYVVRCG